MAFFRDPFPDPSPTINRSPSRSIYGLSGADIIVPIDHLLNEFTQQNDLHHYIFYLRAPLISGILLVLFPLIAIKTKISALLRNLFVMSKGYQVAIW
jgi:hypothetical protein